MGADLRGASANSKNTSQDNYEFLKTAGSIACAGAGAFVTCMLAQIPYRKAESSLYRESMFSNFILNGREAGEMFSASGLQDKGIKLKDIKRTELLKYKPAKGWKNIFANYAKQQEIGDINSVAQGYDSLFCTKTKSIKCNTKLFGMAIPHEMGHAMNYTDRGFAKILSKTRGLSRFAPIALAIGILCPPQKEGEKSETLIGKTLDFTKEHCVAISAISQTPMLLEEGLASMRGEKLAKKFMTPEKFKAIKIFNRKAWLTYAAFAATMTAMTYTGSKLRNLTA